MKKNKLFLNSISFKTWLYFMLFALSILLILCFFQIVMLQPAYIRTLKSQIVELNKDISDISFSGLDDETKNMSIYNLTAENNACIIIYNTETTVTRAFDVLGENGCAIYHDQSVNPTIIDEMNSEPGSSFYTVGNYLDLSNQEVMIYGEKKKYNNTVYYVIANFALQSMKNVIRTSQSQFFIIMLLTFVMAVIISFIFSRVITRPILNIKNESVKLTQGNYDLNFEESEFNEVDELSETLNLAANELNNLEVIRKELMANVSHDLKTPITMIKAYAEMIKDISGDNKEKRDEHLDIILTETDNLNKLVSDILDLSSLQAGAVSLNIEPFDLSGTIMASCARFNDMVKSEDITIQLECEPELVAYGDERRINEVLYNFISNALKHYGDDRLVIVKAFLTTRNKIRVEVADHGPGIDEEILPYIWDRYFKSDKTYRRSQTGSGLGLAINKAILDEHKSEYGVITKKGEGSLLYFELEAAIDN